MNHSSILDNSYTNAYSVPRFKQSSNVIESQVHVGYIYKFKFDIKLHHTHRLKYYLEFGSHSLIFIKIMKMIIKKKTLNTIKINTLIFHQVRKY